MEASKAKEIVARKHDNKPGLKAARLHIHSKTWHLLRKLSEYVHLTLPCREYNLTDTSVSFEFTKDILTSEVEFVMYNFSHLLDTRDRCDIPHGCEFYIDAAIPTPDYTAK